MTGAAWRPMAPGDLDAVAAIARLGFPDHFEDRACFAERLALYPRGCFALEALEGGVVGYLIAYPWMAGSAPALNTLVGALPAAPDLIYLHDLALHPDWRGQGFTRPIVDRLVAEASAEGWPAVALVAVNDAADFWRGLGFKVDEPSLAAKLATYGDDARYMRRAL